MKKPKIVEKKLGRHKAAGFAYVEDKEDKDYNTIEIDPRLAVHGGNKGYMDTVIHEALHTIDPIMHEDDVADMAKKITALLWEHGYRRVNL